MGTSLLQWMHFPVTYKDNHCYMTHKLLCVLVLNAPQTTTEAISFLSRSKSKSCWIGRMKTFLPPTTLFRCLGKCDTANDMASRSLVLGMQHRRSKSPHPSNLGNTSTLVESSYVMFGMLIFFFSPKPTCTKVSLSATVHGTLVALWLLRQTIFTIQFWPFFAC